MKTSISGLWRATLVLCVLPWLLLRADPALAGNPKLAESISAYENFEYEDALRGLTQALRHKGSTQEELARIHLYTGLVQFTLGNQAAAEKAFTQALKLRYDIELPPDTSPKISTAFAAVKKTVPGPKKPEPPPTDPKPDPLAQKPDPKPKPPIVPPPPPAPGGRLWTWVAAGVGGAALVGAGVFGGLALSAKADFDDEQWAGQAAELRDSVETNALAANILFGLGGAALTAALVLFFVEDGGDDSSRATSLTIEPGPLSVQATVRF